MFVPLAERSVVRNISVLGQDSYGRAGLSHMTISGAVHHGMKEVDLFLPSEFLLFEY